MKPQEQGWVGPGCEEEVAPALPVVATVAPPLQASHRLPPLPSKDAVWTMTSGAGGAVALLAGAFRNHVPGASLSLP